MMERTAWSILKHWPHCVEQMESAVHAFASDKHPVGELLQLMVSDVERAMQEPLEMVPHCHHSPSLRYTWPSAWQRSLRK